MTMIISLKDMLGLKIAAKDGEIGKAKDFYFDDVGWNIRYLVIETGNFLLGKKVLISHYSFKQPDRQSEHIPIDLTMDKIRNSPDIGEKMPISRQKEQELAMYYQWPLYWMNMNAVPPEESVLLRNMWSEEMIEEKNKNKSVLEAHLRSFSEVKSYNINARDTNIGHVDDLLVDDKTWKIRYLVIDTRKWLPGGKNVLISPAWIEKVNWSENNVYVDQEADVIENSPEYNPEKPVDPDFEVNLFKHYGR